MNATDFLKNNGFKKTGNVYMNDKCTITISDHYCIMNLQRDTIYSDDLDIYWLVGILTWYGYIDKNYVK